MATFSLTKYLQLKKVKPGQRDWANEECSNWDIVDQFAQWIASTIDKVTGGTLEIPEPIFNTTVNSIEINGLEPSGVVYSYDTYGRIIQGIETYSDLGLTKMSGYTYLDDGRLDTIISDFDDVIRTEKFHYRDNGDMLNITVTEVSKGSF